MTDLERALIIIYPVCGLVLGLGAFLIALKAGNTLTPLAAQQAAFRIGYRNFSLSAGNALVGLIVLTVICMAGVPSLQLVLGYYSTTHTADLNAKNQAAITALRGKDQALSLVALLYPSTVPFTVGENQPHTTALAELKFCKTGVPQTFYLTPEGSLGAIVIELLYDSDDDSVAATVIGRSRTTRLLPLHGKTSIQMPGALEWPPPLPGPNSASALKDARFTKPKTLNQADGLIPQ